MPDIATLGLALDSRPIVDGTKALDALGESAVRVEQRVKTSNGQMADTAKIMRAQEEAAKATAAANTALGGSTSQLTLGQQQLIEKYREQAATIGMSRSQLMAYQAAQMGVTAETEKAVATVKAHEDALKAAAKAKDDATRSSNQLSDALKLLAAGYALLKIGEYVKDAALMAARYETLGVVLEVVGRNAGYTKTQMDAAADGIARQGITMLESRNSAVKLVQAHVDLANATGLARIAQDAAVIGNINSSEAFDRLVNGISRGNVLILRNIGINVNLQTAYTQMADSLGKTTKELSENERVQARLNAVIERGTDIAGTYEAAMGTAGKQLLSMQRYIDDLKVKAGEAFNEVLTVGVMAFTDHLKDANGEVTELAKNGQLAQWGHDLAAVMVGVANAIDNVLTGAKMAGTWAGHFSVSGNIDTQYSRKLSEAPKDQQAVIRREWAMALANEQAQYDAAQTDLGGRADRFQRAFDERTATQLAKQKATVEAKLKVDQDYAARSQALMIENAGKSLQIQQAAQTALAKSVYGGTPTYRDTEGRESKEKIDQAENTRLADHIKRIEAEVAAEKAGSEYMMRIDEMRHQAGELGDAQFYERRRGYADEIAGAEIAGYNKELAALRAHHNNTEAEAAKNAAAIHDTLDKLAGAKSKYAYDDLVRDEEERLRKRAIAMASDDMVNKYISLLEKEAQKIEDSNTKHEELAAAVQREEIARLDLAIAYQKQFMAEQLVNGANEAELAQSPAILKFLEDQRALRERIANGLDTADLDKANKKASEDAARAWKHTATTVENDLTNAILDGGGRGWKKLVHDMEFAFARMILQPILQPISGDIASFVNPGAPQAGGAGGTASGYVGVAQSAQKAYDAISTGFTGLSNQMGSMVSTVGDYFGSNSVFSFGQGMQGFTAGGEGSGISSGAASAGQSTVGAASFGAAWLAGAAIGRSLGNKISDGYSVNGGNGGGFVNFSTLTNSVPMLGGIAGGLVNRAFGMREKETTAAGVRGNLGPTGFSGETFADWEQKGGWFRSDKHGTETAVVDPETTKKFSSAYSSITTAATDYAKTLGINADSIATRTQALNIALTADSAANDKAIAEFFSGVGESITKELVPSISEFSKEGETASATFQRIAQDFAFVDAALASINSTFGAVGLGSVAARERLIDLSGGLDAFGKGVAGFAQNYLTEEERLKPVAKTVNETLEALGFVGDKALKTRDDFKAAVLGLMDSGKLATEAGATTYAGLIKVQDGFAQLHPEIQSTADALQAIRTNASDLLGGVDAAFSVLQRVTQSSIDVLDKRIAKEKALSDAIRSALDNKMPGTEAADRARAQADIKAALAIAKAGGPLPDADALKRSLGIVSQDASSQFSTLQDYQRDFYSTQNDIAALGNLADSALSVDQQSLDSLNGMLDAAQKQIDLLKGIDTSALTIAGAMAGLQLAIASANQNPIIAATPGINSAYQNALGRAPDKPGLEYWQNQAAGGMSQTDITAGIANSAEAQMQKMYQQLLGRPADAAGMAFFLNSGASMSQISDDIKHSDEYKKSHPIPGFANGGDHMGGLRLVGEVGPEIEDTRASRVHSTRDLMDSLRNPSSNNAELVAEIRSLREELIAVKREVSRGNEDAKRTADTLQGQQGVPFLVEIAQ